MKLEDGETYEITRAQIGDIAVGAEVTLENVVGQGEWCFVTTDTISGDGDHQAGCGVTDCLFQSKDRPSL